MNGRRVRAIKHAGYRARLAAGMHWSVASVDKSVLRRLKKDYMRARHGLSPLGGRVR